MQTFTIIAGPCSIDEQNIDQAIEIGRLPEVDGVRCVGLKSVTSPRPFMGIDRDWYFGGCRGTPPSVKLARKIVKETGKHIAFEVMDNKQLAPLLYDPVFENRVFLWNPAIMQLGWPLFRAARLAASQGWAIGLKNPKWSGEPELELTPDTTLDNGEKTWWGNAKFVEEGGIKPVMIQRGIEGAGKYPYRNIPNHAASACMRTLGYEVWIDPSHIFGKALRDEIVERTLEALELRLDDGRYLYDGLLVEVGTSQTDTDQHITIEELEGLIEAIKRQRNP